MWRLDLSFGLELPMRMSNAVKRVTVALDGQGLEVVPLISFSADSDAPEQEHSVRYQLLSVYDPFLAKRAFRESQAEMALLFHCHVIFYKAERGGTCVLVGDPVKAVAVLNQQSLVQLAESLKAKLSAALFTVSRAASLS